MGKRSRRRLGEPFDPVVGERPQGSDPAAARASDGRETRQPQGTGDEGPPAPPWGSFPLTEVAVLVSLVMVVGGFIAGGRPGTAILLAGLAIGSIAGFEQALREHRGGYRPHSAALAGIPAVLAITVMAVLGVPPVIFGPVGLGIAIGAWLPLRSSFQRRER